MKLQTRKGVFETNSSSMHAICISGNTYIGNLPEKLQIKCESYGRWFEILDTPEQKASYLCSILGDKLYSSTSKYSIGDFVERMREIGIDVNIDGVDDCCVETSGTYDIDKFMNYVFENNEHMKDYIFGNSIVVTGGDEYPDFSQFLYGSDTGYYKNSDVLPEIKDQFKIIINNH